MKNESVQHSFYLSKVFDAEVRAYTRDSGVSFSELARRGMALYMKANPLPGVQLELPLDPAL